MKSMVDSVGSRPPPPTVPTHPPAATAASFDISKVALQGQKLTFVATSKTDGKKYQFTCDRGSLAEQDFQSVAAMLVEKWGKLQQPHKIFIRKESQKADAPIRFTAEKPRLPQPTKKQISLIIQSSDAEYKLANKLLEHQRQAEGQATAKIDDALISHSSNEIAQSGPTAKTPASTPRPLAPSSAPVPQPKDKSPRSVPAAKTNPLPPPAGMGGVSASQVAAKIAASGEDPSAKIWSFKPDQLDEGAPDIVEQIKTRCGTDHFALGIHGMPGVPSAISLNVMCSGEKAAGLGAPPNAFNLHPESDERHDLFPQMVGYLNDCITKHKDIHKTTEFPVVLLQEFPKNDNLGRQKLIQELTKAGLIGPDKPYQLESADNNQLAYLVPRQVDAAGKYHSVQGNLITIPGVTANDPRLSAWEIDRTIFVNLHPTGTDKDTPKQLAEFLDNQTKSPHFKQVVVMGDFNQQVNVNNFLDLPGGPGGTPTDKSEAITAWQTLMGEFAPIRPIFKQGHRHHLSSPFLTTTPPLPARLAGNPVDGVLVFRPSTTAAPSAQSQPLLPVPPSATPAGLVNTSATLSLPGLDGAAIPHLVLNRQVLFEEGKKEVQAFITRMKDESKKAPAEDKKNCLENKTKLFKKHMEPRVPQGDDPVNIFQFGNVSVPTDLTHARLPALEQVVDWKHSGKEFILWGNTKAEPGEKVIKVNFANANLGGGAFGHGWVQEEVKVAESTDAAQLVALHQSGKLTLRVESNDGKPTPLLIQNLHADVQLKNRLGYKDEIYKQRPTIDSDVKVLSDGAPSFDELALTAQNLGTQPGKDSLESAQHIFESAYRGFKGCRAVYQGEKVVVETGRLGAGVFNNNLYVSIGAQLLAAAEAGVTLRFKGIDPSEVEKVINFLQEKAPALDAAAIPRDALLEALVDYGKSKTP